MASAREHLEAYLLRSLPAAGYYIPNFITTEEEQAILAAIYLIPLKSWTFLSHRRLLSLPAQLTGIKRDTLIDAEMPSFLQEPIAQRLRDLRLFESSPHKSPNHCLVNEYCPGQGIMPHEDGPAYYPITATVSLGSHTVLDIYNKNEDGEKEADATWRILQEPRSLLITSSEMYRKTLHGIGQVTADSKLGSDDIVNWNMLGDQAAYANGSKQREKRVSLTYRDVIKVSKLGGALKFMVR